MPLPQFLLTTAVASAAPHASEQQLLDVDATLFIQLALFLILTFVMKRWLFEPYLSVRAERITRVEGFKADAARIEANAAARLARCEADLAEARRAGAGLRAVALAEAHTREQAIVAESQAAAQRTLTEARAKLELTLKTERAAAEARVVEIGREAARKILGREVSA